MDIIQQRIKFCHRIVPFVPKQVVGLFQFGLSTLGFQTIKSFRSQSRLSQLSWQTAKTKMCRLLANIRIPKVFLSLVLVLNIVNEEDIICVDFSDFGNGFQVLMFAKQTKKGRALPIYFEVLKYPIAKGSQNLFIISAIKNFTELIGFKLTLVFDRGFACPSIIRFLALNSHKFIIRVKKSKLFINPQINEKFKTKDVKENDIVIFGYNLNVRLRLIVSDKPNNDNDPWYLITNDSNSSREKIIESYYHRFEIEEFFRDTKRLLGLEYINFKKENSLTVALWFAVLTTWFLWEVKTQMSKADQKLREEMKLSYVRYCLEALQKTILLAAEKQFQKQYYLSSNFAYQKV